MSLLQAASVLVLAFYILSLLAGSRLASKAAGRSVWLFGAARGRDRIAALGFRASFALALLGPVIWALMPDLSALSLSGWTGYPWLTFIGHMLGICGAGFAFAAQMAMGASWRVGVSNDAVGELVSAGLFTLSRNPTFVGQAALLVGVALAVPTLAGVFGVILFIASAQMQIRSEEAALLKAHGEAFTRYTANVPRWLRLT